MLFVKKILWGLTALFLIFLGGAGTQTQSTLLQGGGFLGLIIGLVVLYIFAKMAWRAMGCLPSLFLIFAIILFIMYAIGAFKGGISNVGSNLKSFLGQKSAQTELSATSSGLLDEEDFDISISENFSQQGEEHQEEYSNEASESGLLKEFFGSKRKPSLLNPRDYPAIYSNVKVSSADTLIINGRYFRLFGVDAPEANQSCADANGYPYKCGQYASAWLKSWLQDNELECRVIQQDDSGNMIGVCFLGDYDIGAALVNAGWAVVYFKHSKIYMPYQMQAQKNRVGLWQGDFYMPWDWRKIQNRKPKIKIINRQPKRKRAFSIL